MTVHGIDVSSHQAANWSTTGRDFVFIKATEGHTLTDPAQAAHAARARSAGAVVGFYHFLWPGNIAEQAQYFVTQCDSVEGDLLICDWETTGSGTHATCAEKDQFLAAVKQLRPTHRVLLYCNVNDWKTRDTTSNAADGLWIAEYGVPAGDPDIKAAWAFHQYTDAPLDTSIGQFADRAALAAWAGAPAPPKPPAKPKVSLKNVIAAAKADPKAAQGHATHPADVKPVEAALHAEGLLAAKYASDGSFGSLTVDAYASWQRKCGYSGKDADGIPGETTLKKLGSKHGFTVVA